MPVQTGSRIGPYEVESALGAGGMGEVYRARDTRLNRRVAIKSLPAAFAQDPQRVARFTREAQLLAALNHPHIAGIHGLEEVDGSQFLVLEFVDGETLADRLARGPIRPDDAIRIAGEVVDALEAAHEKGIVHRDLKPANVALTADGQVKVLDFGLARYESNEREGAADITHSPTLASPGTHAGVILGTASYMSPEQASGRPVDKRTDVWAFGCLLFEMLTGKKAFEGRNVTDTLAAVLRSEPAWATLPSDVTPAVRTIIKRCLERDRRQRIPDLSVVRFLIADSASPDGPATLDPQRKSTIVVAPLRRIVLPWIVASAIALGLVGVVALWAPWRRAAGLGPVRISVDVGADTSLLPGSQSLALSPDGTMIAFTGVATSGGTHLFTRRLNQLQATTISGADGATMPFFSPEGQWIGFFAGGKLKKVAVAGGAPITLCDAPLGGGGSWGDDGMIVFQPAATAGTPLQRVSAAGGTPTALLSMQDGERRQRWPQILPGTRAVIFTSLSDNSGSWETATIEVQKLPGGPRTVLQRNAYFGRYSRSGHLLYMQQNTLFAAPFDVNRLEVTGSAVPVTDAPLTYNGASQFAISDTGMAAYVQGANTSAAAAISWLDSAGKLSPLRTMQADWASPSFSPDGMRLAMDISDGTQTDIWIYDWAHDTMSRLTFDPADDVRPSWSPDGQRVVFASKRENGVQNLYWQRADGVGEAQKLTDGPNLKYGGSVHPGGKFLAYAEMRPGTAGDIMILPLDGDDTVGWKPGTPTVFLSTRFNESSPMFSPDGRWIAYLSNESGHNEVYVRPFPGPGGKWQIWDGLADDPIWSRARHELLFVSAVDLRIMSAPYAVEGDSFRAEKPQFWSPGLLAPRTRAMSRDVDLHPDGLRFAIAPGSTATSAKLDKIVLTFNFFDELKRLTAKK